MFKSTLPPTGYKDFSRMPASIYRIQWIFQKLSSPLNFKVVILTFDKVHFAELKAMMLAKLACVSCKEPIKQ